MMATGSLIGGNYCDEFTKYNDFAGVLADLSDQSTVELLVRLREQYTTRLARQPYDASCWYDRGVVYIRLRYPELAASDAYKAIKLARREKDELLYVLAMLLLCQALFFAQSFHECNVHIQKTYATGFSGRLPRDLRHQLRVLDVVAAKCEKQARRRLASEGLDSREIEHEIRHGEIQGGLHPWLAERHKTRSKKAVRAMRRAAASLSRGLIDVKRSHVPSSMVQDCYGIYANVDITNGRRIFTEPPAFVAMSSQAGGRCNHCGHTVSPPNTNGIASVRAPFESRARYCSTACEIRFRELYGDDGAAEPAILRFIAAEVGKKSRSKKPERSIAIERLRYRILRNIQRQLRSGDDATGTSPHPLETTPICQLAGHNAVAHPTLFSFWGDVEMPIGLLQLMGIDIFADQRFDTDVLLAISRRTNMNSWEEEEEGAADGRKLYSTGVSPVYSLFNHSCTPNVSWEFFTTGSIIATAKRPILAGEELFISYLDPSQLRLPQAARQEALKQWTNGSHYCTRCSEGPLLSEEAEKGADGDEEEDDGGGGDGDSDDGDSGVTPEPEPEPDLEIEWQYTPRPTRTRRAGAVFESLPDSYTEGLYRKGMYGKGS